jgi:sulfur relay (sulfurtransferase) DsrC/TusE family protein
MSVNASAFSAAQFIDIDKTTRKDWPGSYGTEGHIIISGNPAHQNIPSYASVDFEGDWGLPMFWTWWAYDREGYYSDYVNRRAQGVLYTTPEKDGQIAACYYSGGIFTVSVDVGSEEKTVSLYMHDYDEHSRTALVYVMNEEHTDYLIEPIEVAQYERGWYLRFQVTGAVQFMIEDTSPNSMNAVLSGVFIDPADAGINLRPAAASAGEDAPSGDAGGAYLYGFGEEESSVFDGEFVMALTLLGIIYIVLLLGVISLTSRFVDKIQERRRGGNPPPIKTETETI